MVSDYNFKFSLTSSACGVEVTASDGKSLWFESYRDMYFANLNFCAFSAIVLLPIFVGVIHVAQFFFEVSAFFLVAITTKFEMMTESRSSIPVGTCFFSN